VGGKTLTHSQSCSELPFHDIFLPLFMYRPAIMKLLVHAMCELILWTRYDHVTLAKNMLSCNSTVNTSKHEKVHVS